MTPRGKEEEKAQAQETSTKTHPEDPFNSLPDEVIPGGPTDPHEAQAPPYSSLQVDLPKHKDEYIKEDHKRRLTGKRRLMGRRLWQEQEQLEQFLALGLESAIVRCHTKKEAMGRRARFYFARRQKDIMASESPLTELREEANQLYELLFEVDRDDKSWFIRLRRRHPGGLEPE